MKSILKVSNESEKNENHKNWTNSRVKKCQKFLLYHENELFDNCSCVIHELNSAKISFDLKDVIFS